MMTFISSLIIFASCGQPSADNSITSEFRPDNYEIRTHTYDSLSIPAFISSLLKNHISDYAIINSAAYQDLSNANDLNPLDSGNIEKFYSIMILHDLFTSQTASNCSKGEILNIPYQWHWVKPNPRYSIYLVKTGKLLKDIKPPAEFSKYGSFADIDRTPYLFLSDLFSENPGYYSASCDTFSTFGWCSEREMAFISLLELLGYTGKVVAEDNHSWSELMIPMKTRDGKIKNFDVRVDNTFNGLSWSESKDKEAWKKYLGNSSLAGWYNQKAHSGTDKQKIRSFIVSEKACNRIELSMVAYLKKLRK